MNTRNPVLPVHYDSAAFAAIFFTKTSMPPLPDPEEDDYNSTSDSDFNDAELSASSAEEESEADDANAANAKGQKRRTRAKDVDGDVEMASGDEGIVAQGRKKKRKKGKGKGSGKGKGEGTQAVDEDDEDDAPVGVRVRLRSGRGGEEYRKAALPTASSATADIDSIWARMNNPQALKSLPPPIEIQEEAAVPADPTAPTSITADHPHIEVPLQSPHNAEATITIPHTYTFAGQTHISTKIVPASSPATLAFLASQEKDKPIPPAAGAGPTLRRPLARKGLLEPNPSRFVNIRGPLPQRTDLPLSIGGSWTLASAAAAVEKAGLGKGKESKGEKLNTVEKSKLDWEAEVERQGMREELEKAEKSGSSYLGRVEFLRRVEGGDEERARVARLAKAGLA